MTQNVRAVRYMTLSRRWFGTGLFLGKWNCDIRDECRLRGIRPDVRLDAVS